MITQFVGIDLYMSEHEINDLSAFHLKYTFLGVQSYVVFYKQDEDFIEILMSVAGFGFDNHVVHIHFNIFRIKSLNFFFH